MIDFNHSLEAGMIRRIYAMAIACLLLVLIPVVVWSQSRTVTAEGMGSTKAQAIEQAKREAVASGIGLYMVAETEVQDFQLKRDQIISRANGYVKNYREIGSTTEADGTVKVKIEAEVTAMFDEMLKDQMALQLLLSWLKKPRFMVVLEEDNLGDTKSIVASTEINRVLKSKGFDVVSEQQIAAAKNKQAAQKAIEGDAQAAQTIGNQYNAEIIVTGRAETSKGEGARDLLGGMTSVQAVISASIIRTDNGDILATSNAQGRNVHISPEVAGSNALKQAADMLTDTLVVETIKGWGLEQSNTKTVTLNISGIETRAQKKAIFDKMESDITFVKSVNQRQFSPPVLEVAVEIAGTTDDLADALDGKNFGDFRLVITAETPNTLTLKVAK
jgi:hypothetical protein